MLNISYLQLALIIFLSFASLATLTIFIQHIIKSYKKHRAINVTISKVNEENIFMIWQCIYTETSESLRDYAKNMVLLAVGAIGLVTILLSIVKSLSESPYFQSAFMMLTLNLIISLYSNTAIADQRKEDLSKFHKAIANKRQKSIEIPHPHPRGLWMLFAFYAPLLTLALSLFLCNLTIITSL